MKQATAMAQLTHTGDIDGITSLASTHHDQSVSKCYPKLDSHGPLQEVLDNSTVTKELAEILAPLEQYKEPQFILVEGAPGIGKSILLKEIAYRWGNKQLLKTFKLVLLVSLRDPNVQQAVSVSDLLQNFCGGNRRAMEIAAACHDHLSENGGKDLTFLFDGFDEFPTELHKNSLVSKIINCKLLSNCTLVVSSHPHAVAHLRQQATVRVDILGFTKVEQYQFIQQALKEQPQRIKELTQYLEDHFTISSLCVVPFNMVALLFLYKQGISLPNNSTELYNHFICLTICRHLAKHGHVLNNAITDLTNLPDPCNKIIKQLSKLSLETINNKKLIFTYDEITMACPDIRAILGAINGFGLLQAVQHFGLTGKTLSFNFLHLSVQEFLAAHHILCLTPSDELKILKEKFWSETHSNVFAMYVTLTKGQRTSFQHFIMPSLKQRIKRIFKSQVFEISNEFLDTYLKCLHLFRCFFEAGNKEICRCIEKAKIFDIKIITLWNTRLSSSDVECLTVFLTCSSHKEWEELNLCGCYIQDRGVYILHRGLTSCNVTIAILHLNYNGLTESSSAAISDITISCKLKELYIGSNKIVGEDKRLHSIISNPSSVLELLYMSFNRLSWNGAIKLFTALGEGNKLKALKISFNNITDEACDAMIVAMKKNTSLIKLMIYNNPLSGECVQHIRGGGR